MQISEFIKPAIYSKVLIKDDECMLFHFLQHTYLPISRMDLTPDDTSARGQRESSCRSAEMSKAKRENIKKRTSRTGPSSVQFSPPRWTPPSLRAMDIRFQDYIFLCAGRFSPACRKNLWVHFGYTLY